MVRVGQNAGLASPVETKPFTAGADATVDVLVREIIKPARNAGQGCTFAIARDTLLA